MNLLNVFRKNQNQETPSTGRRSIASFLTDYVIYLVLFILFVVIVAINPAFLSWGNFGNILQQSSTRIIFALGVGGIIVAKGTDLSLGRQVGLAAVISASLLQNVGYVYRMYPNLPALPVVLPILVVMLVCMLVSMVNGIVVAKLKVDAFIATLGMMIIAYGLTSIYFDRPPHGASPIGSLDPRFTRLATGRLDLGIIRVPYIIIIAAVTTVIIWVIWNKTRFGKNIFAIGGNQEAARVSGVNVARNLITIFALAGLLYGLGGALEAARVGSATNNTGNGYELDAISACIVGGLSFNGGIGTISGIVTGVLIFQVIAYGLNFISVTPYLQNVIKGLIIIIAVAIDSQKYATKK